MLRRRLLLLVGLVALAAAVPLTANGARSGNSKTLPVPLPAPNGTSIVTRSVELKGKGPLRVTTANDSALGNLSLIYAVGTPVKSRATSTWTIVVFIKRFLSERRSAGTGGGSVEVSVDWPDGQVAYKFSAGWVPLDCAGREAFDKGFEGGGSVNLNGGTFTLSNGRTPGEQPSPPEEVMDNVLASSPGCPNFKPEGNDPGNK